ncbi:tetratricopeptide repeat protein [Flavobacterium sp. C4GT6]|uniref:tetratricopeptide repeat protein n=1 Tax=Flavobacterium sp. C4GT6 TaxID=3103818 RepID=UPI002ED3FB9A
MNTKDFTYLLNKPYSVTDKHTMDLESVLYEFPYLQSARAIHLKGLYNQDSFRYNMELKKTASHTNDRSVLFDFITSENFQSIQKDFLEEKEKAIEEITVKDTETIQTETEETETPTPPANRLERSIEQTIKEAEENKRKEEEIHDIPAIVSSPVFVPKEENEKQVKNSEQEPQQDETEKKLEIGKPLEFNKAEQHSFQEWLQLSKLMPINRETEPQEEITAKSTNTVVTEDAPIEEPEKEETENSGPTSLDKKLELIDKFIESNPKIVPVRNATQPVANIERSSSDSSLPMTETLARVYLEQKKYQKAIQAYEILILKYPEKSVFFADRIADIKILQQNNNINNNG